MRMRKKKWAEPYLQAHTDYALDNPEENKGKWKEVLHGQKLHVEIGSGKGGYLLAMSNANPADAWVGIEKDRNAAAVAVRKQLEDEQQPGNRCMIVGEAEDLEKWFAPGEIDVIHLNFSDPWPHKRTHKRRLSAPAFLDTYRKLLAKDGYIAMKTDNKDLFEDSVICFVNAGYVFMDFSVDFRRNPHPEDAITEYEQKFMDLGQPIYQLTARPCKPAGDMLK